LPLPTVLFFTFATGIAAALAGRSELRVSPRPAMLSNAAAAYLVFVSLTVVPASLYFYLCHGDWFLLYLLDVRRVPSAIALLAFVGQAGLGLAGFALGASLVRSQRETAAGGVVGVSLLAAGLVGPLARERLAVVGSFAQYEGGFGLKAYGAGALLPGTIVMGLIVLGGLTYLLVRLHFGDRRDRF